MKKSSALSEKIKGYSILASAILGSGLASDAQVVYTNVEPDFYSDYFPDSYNIDLNNDGITDFVINGNFDAESSGSYSLSVTIDPASGNSAGSFPMDYGNLIDSNLADLNSATKQLAFLSMYSNSTDSHVINLGGNWLNQSEKFMGLHFMFNGESHYGWVRLSVGYYADFYIVHDYAYEAIPDSSIIAGDVGCVPYYVDADNDGFGSEDDPGVIFCTNPGPGFSLNNSDCNDNNNAINPNVWESCNGIDDNCNGSNDEGLSFYTYYVDGDQDGYGSELDPGNSLCYYPGPGYSSNNADCDDTNISINPSAWEICNGLDDNCNSAVDEGLYAIYYVDADGDGSGSVLDAGISLCNDPGAGYSLNNDDCDDTDSTIHPSAPAIDWQKCFGGSSDDLAYAIQQTSDHGFIVTGISYSNDGNVSGHHGYDFYTDFWIVKIDSLTNIEWQKSLGGSLNDGSYSVKQTIDGGFVAAGYALSNDGDISGTHSGYFYGDYWIVKLDATGNIEWQKCLGGAVDEAANSIEQTTDGGFVVTGWTTSNNGDVSDNHGGEDCWTVKLDASGNIEWQKCLGGYLNERSYSVKQTIDGGFITAGYTFSNNDNVSGNHGSDDYWVVKFDAAGNTQWQKCYGGNDFDAATSVEQTKDGGYILSGSSRSHDGDVSGNHGYSDAWIVKLDSTGNILWQRSLGGSDNDNANSIQQTTDNGYIVIGYSYSNDGNVSGHHGNSGHADYWVVKLDALGNIKWQESLGGLDQDEGSSVEQTTDGGYIIAGNTKSNGGNVSGNYGGNDYWIVKLSSNNTEGLQTYFEDADGDGFGNPNTTTESCSAPIGFVSAGTDCNDVSAAVNPLATEVCNTIDDNCDGTVDEGVQLTFYADVDGDNYGNSDSSVLACTLPTGYSTDNTDCDDNNGAVNPSATEVCNGIDDDCNLIIDDGFIYVTYFADADGDGFGNPNVTTSFCDAPTGYVSDSTDCDDSNTDINPSVTEIFGNNIDDNCDGYVDEFGTGNSELNTASLSLSVFPNPTNGAFTVYQHLADPGNSKAKIELLNLLGQVLTSKVVQIERGELQTEIQMSQGLTSGMYVVKVMIDNKVYIAQINFLGNSK